ncbi:MAG TPA: EAL domain-containing response regulator [Nitrosomonas sp.]|nr:EAL domain-containing response regulator [Nitrosomonas sp.]HMW21622.1 EAL domain-containing response regulator [Nitrosomonas sp.]HMW69707.1 EAL domain-containing response regulator [Nitrosomonas sp.]HMY62507.1 EAL domain-containing response regulator [Nitrosomonas sp.]HNA71184.1 EAL domain-containing response regulator [Nitrosomonas sp.]
MIDKSTIKILILDDEPFMLKLLARMLANQGFVHVVCCNNGNDALAQLNVESTRPDLILLDLNMPEMDGIEFIRYLVERQFTGSLILVSGEDERMLKTTERLVQAHKIAVLGYLQKPVKPDALLAMLAQWSPPSKAAPTKPRKTYSADDIRLAIVRGELVNYYQPKVSVATGTVIGVETLVRWQHATDGLVFPNQFITVAESSGLINELTRLVLLNAFNQAKRWQQSGMDLRVAVNVSMDNLASLDFQDLVVDLATQVGIPPNKIVLEVTESQLMRDIRVSLEILTRLRLKRFHLSIDDFGTGHSSLAQLRDIPFDELKIDQGFVHQAWRDDTLRVIYDASLALAKQLNMESVAEGVEDRQDWDFLRQTGCDLAQGNFISKPLLASEFGDWITYWQQRVKADLMVDNLS